MLIACRARGQRPVPMAIAFAPWPGRRSLPPPRRRPSPSHRCRPQRCWRRRPPTAGRSPLLPRPGGVCIYRRRVGVEALGAVLQMPSADVLKLLTLTLDVLQAGRQAADAGRETGDLLVAVLRSDAGRVDRFASCCRWCSAGRQASDAACRSAQARRGRRGQPSMLLVAVLGFVEVEVERLATLLFVVSGRSRSKSTPGRQWRSSRPLRLRRPGSPHCCSSYRPVDEALQYCWSPCSGQSKSKSTSCRCCSWQCSDPWRPRSRGWSHCCLSCSKPVATGCRCCWSPMLRPIEVDVDRLSMLLVAGAQAAWKSKSRRLETLLMVVLEAESTTCCPSKSMWTNCQRCCLWRCSALWRSKSTGLETLLFVDGSDRSTSCR